MLVHIRSFGPMTAWTLGWRGDKNVISPSTEQHFDKADNNASTRSDAVPMVRCNGRTSLERLSSAVENVHEAWILRG